VVSGSNTPECLRDFIGQRVLGVLVGRLPIGSSVASGTHSFIFEDGRAFTFSRKGGYWIDSAADVRRAIDRAKRDLTAAQQEIAGVLELAGAHAKLDHDGGEG
jgi:hypothetical protein